MPCVCRAFVTSYELHEREERGGQARRAELAPPRNGLGRWDVAVADNAEPLRTMVEAKVYKEM